PEGNEPEHELDGDAEVAASTAHGLMQIPVRVTRSTLDPRAFEVVPVVLESLDDDSKFLHPCAEIHLVRRLSAETPNGATSLLSCFYFASPGFADSARSSSARCISSTPPSMVHRATDSSAVRKARSCAITASAHAFRVAAGGPIAMRLPCTL